MEKSHRRKLKCQAKAQLGNNDYALNAGRMPRLAEAVGLPQNVSDPQYLEAVKSIAAKVLFPLEDAPIMGLRDRGPEGDSLLHVACAWGDLRSVRLLVQAGSEIDPRDEMDETPLHIAVNGRYLDIVKFLSSRGADPNIKDAFGYSPLEWALQMGYMEIADVLRKR